MLKPGLINETFGLQTYWFSKKVSFEKSYKRSVYILPAFDEFVISYKDRSSILSSAQHKQAVSINGIFRPVIVINGNVCGLWNRTFSKNKVMITTEFFETPGKSMQRPIEKAFKAFGAFLNKEVVVDM